MPCQLDNPGPSPGRPCRAWGIARLCQAWAMPEPGRAWPTCHPSMGGHASPYSPYVVPPLIPTQFTIQLKNYIFYLLIIISHHHSHYSIKILYISPFKFLYIILEKEKTMEPLKWIVIRGRITKFSDSQMVTILLICWTQFDDSTRFQNLKLNYHIKKIMILIRMFLIYEEFFKIDIK